MWDLSSLTTDRTHVPSVEAQSLNHWTTREVPKSRPVPKKAAPVIYIPLQVVFWKHTFNLSLEVRVSVENLHLLPPVKFIPPVGDDFLQIVGVETVVEAAVLQRWG